MTSPTMHAAIRYAELGIAVFPLQPKQKAPYGRTVGLHMASASPKMARERWMGHWTLPLKDDAKNRHPVTAGPSANIGIATGAPAGFWVLDIDGPNGAAWLAMVEAQHGPLPDTVEQLTARGRHICFALPADVLMKNRSRVGGTDVDVRGLGGYICAAPSVHPGDPKKGVPPGYVYRWREGRAPGEIGFAPAPAWLIEICRPTEDTAAPRQALAPRVRVEGVASAYGEAALTRTIGVIVGAIKGSRDSTLYRNACSVGCLVAGGEIDGAYAKAELERAGRVHVPDAMSEQQLCRQVERALEWGASRPRSAPVRASGYGGPYRPVARDQTGAAPRRDSREATSDDITSLWFNARFADVGMVRTWLKLRRLPHEGAFAASALRHLRAHADAPLDDYGSRGPALIAVLSPPGDGGGVVTEQDALAILPLVGGPGDRGAERFVHWIGDPRGKAFALTNLRRAAGQLLVAIDLQDAWALGHAAFESGDELGVVVAPTLAGFCGAAQSDQWGRVKVETPSADPAAPPWTCPDMATVYVAVRGDLTPPEMRERRALGGTRRVRLTGPEAARFCGALAEQAWMRPKEAGGPGANRVRLLTPTAGVGFHGLGR